MFHRPHPEPATDKGAVIAFDPDIQMFRGEFVGLNGGADFYAKDVDGLRREGEISLRVDPQLHEAAAIAAAAHGQSLNQWATETIRQAARAE